MKTYSMLKPFTVFKFRGRTFVKVCAAQALTAHTGKDAIFSKNERVIPVPVNVRVCSIDTAAECIL